MVGAQSAEKPGALGLLRSDTSDCPADTNITKCEERICKHALFTKRPSRAR